MTSAIEYFLVADVWGDAERDKREVTNHHQCHRLRATHGPCPVADSKLLSQPVQEELRPPRTGFRHPYAADVSVHAHQI